MHSCVFYQSKEDLLDTTIDYFRAGLDSNVFCLCVVSDPVTATDDELAVRRGAQNVSRHLAADRSKSSGVETGISTATWSMPSGSSAA
jgi:hypothetical protein